MSLDFPNLALVLLIGLSTFKVVRHFHDRHMMMELRRDMHFCYVLLRIWALEGDWPPNCREKLIEAMKEEDLPHDS